MLEIRYVSDSDKPFWFMLDESLSDSEFELKVRDKRGYIISDGDKPVGIMTIFMGHHTISYSHIL